MMDINTFDIRAHMFDFYMSEDHPTTVEEKKRVMVLKETKPKKKNKHRKSSELGTTATIEELAEENRPDFEESFETVVTRRDGPRYITYTFVGDGPTYLSKTTRNKKVPHSVYTDDGTATTYYVEVPETVTTQVKDCIVVRLTLDMQHGGLLITDSSATVMPVPVEDIEHGLKYKTWIPIKKLGYYRKVFTKFVNFWERKPALS